MHLTTLDALRALYGPIQPRAVLKQIPALDVHCRRFIELAPFLILATSNAEHRTDASPRGGKPGFVKVNAAGEILIPDAPGNNRLDSFENILATGRAGLIFMIPGFDETLRVNGRARLSQAADDIALCTDERRAPKLVVNLQVEEAYLHCAKAFMRSRLWQADAQIPRSTLPSAAKMISDQTGVIVPPETQEDMARRYAPDL